MNLKDYFKSVPTMSPDKVRNFIKGKNPDEYNLIDVRELKEYQREHLPGAKLIPTGQMHSRLNEIDRSKPTIVY